MELVSYRKKKRVGVPTSGLFTVVGRPKTGKSSFALSFPDSYMLLLERESEEELEGRVHGIDSLKDFAEAMKAVCADKKIKTIVIDTIDALGDMVADSVAAKFGLKDMSEKKKGVSGFSLWGEYSKRMKNITKHLVDSGKLIIYLAHFKEEQRDEDGKIIKPARLQLNGSAASEFIGFRSKLTGNMYKVQEGGRTVHKLSFEGGLAGQFGSWIKEVEGKTITIEDEKSGYKAFAELFNGGKK